MWKGENYSDNIPNFLGELIGTLILVFFGCGSVAATILFSSSVIEYEHINGILRGSKDSIRTAMMFGEFYPNPGLGPEVPVSTLNAFLAEMAGTFALVFLIFSLTDGCNVGRPDDSLSPLFIGLTVSVIISVIAPLTQAGLNPARDLSPRIFAYLAGWGKAAFPDSRGGFLTVYVIAPITGGILAALLFEKIIKPIMSNKSQTKTCKCP